MRSPSPVDAARDDASSAQSGPRRESATARRSPPDVPAAPAPPPPELTGELFAPLTVPGHGDAVVSQPLGTRTSRPIVVALHGNYDRPEWQCEVFRGILGSRAWVLCPRGVPRHDAPRNADRWTYSGADALNEEVAAGLQALARHRPAFVDLKEPILAGFSLGAILGVSLLTREGQPFSKAILVEGGFSQWSKGKAGAFADQGGRRLLLASGQPSFAQQAKRAGPILEKAGLEVKVVAGVGAGHTYDGAVAEAVAGALEWLLADDARFALPSPDSAP